MLNQLIVSDLKQFGLSEYEARSYLVLSMYGASSASFISEHTTIPSSKIYNILNSLKSKGLIETTISRPRKFKPIDPRCALTNLVAGKELMIKELKSKTKNILQKLNLPENNDNSQIWNSVGRKIFFSKASEIIMNAKKYGIATTSNFSRYPYLDSQFLKSVKKGIKIKMLGTSELTEDAKVRASWYAKNGAEIRILPLDVKPVFGIVDDKDVVFRINSKVECDFMWSNNTSLISIMKSYFEQLWKEAEPIQRCL
ncbi:MAG: helix-turn-helix domain-containing protein [Candidatus Aenigmarchaeota archaeon]|nr:helix-turn-helix domain-containing protein [Candidatus Aenigmarchaeota archaeon]